MKVALKKNNRLIGEKPPNLVGTEEENHVVVQSPRINLCGQWCVELLLHLQSTIAKSGLHLGDLTQLRSVKLSLFATTFLPHGEFL